MSLIDLRSDTVTLPTPAMKECMIKAPLGDDVYGEDPTVNALQEYAAHLLGKEAALFVPSGTMSNQLAVGVHTRPGDELICDPTYHVYLYEGGGIARLWGVSTRSVPCQDGFLSVENLEKDPFGAKPRPQDAHYPRTRLLCLENTTNRMGGRIFPLEKIRKLRQWADEYQIKMHLDGARLFNAVVASGISAKEWCEPFETISICLSKGLGAPVGSLLVGSREDIASAHRLRKVLGGGMRQAGILAAAGLYALEINIPRLQTDHDHAQVLASAVKATEALKLEFGEVESNLVWVRIDSQKTQRTTDDLLRRFKSEGILLSAASPHLFRACTHLQIERSHAERVAELLKDKTFWS